MANALQFTRRRARFPIGFKLAVLLVCAALIPLTVAAVILTRQGLRDVELTAQKNLQLVANVTAGRIDQLIIDTQRVLTLKTSDTDVLRMLSADAEARETLRPAVTAALLAVKHANPDIASAIVADTTGRGVASTSDLHLNKDLAFRDYMKRALAGETFVSDLIVGTTTHEAGIYFAGPVRNGEGAVVGAMVLKLDGEALNALCRETSTQIAHGFAAVTDKYGVVLSHGDAAQRLHTLAPLTPGDLAAMDAKTRFGTSDLPTLHLETLGRAVRSADGPGNVAFVDAAGARQVAGFAAARQRPWIVVAVQPRSEFDRPLQALATSSLFVAAGVAALATAAAVLTARRMVRPVQSLTAAAARIAQGDLTTRAEANTHDELRNLADAFNAMVPKLREHTQMEHSLRLAKEIQRNLLPDAAPLIPGLEVAGANTPADQTGGDYYDFLDLSAWHSNTLAVAVGDVTGHGIPAALLMATARSLLRARATPPGKLAELFADVNKRLYDDTPPERFMTLMYALIDRPARRISLVSAGHDGIIVYVPATGEFRELEGEDLPLAVEPDWAFTEKIYDVPEGAVLVFGTDGIWEAHAPDREMFGKDRLREIIRVRAAEPAADIVDAVKAAVRAWRTPASPQEDDVTVVVVKLV